MHMTFITHVVMTSVESYFDKEEIFKQAIKVKRKKSCGIDGVSAKEALKIAEAEYSSMKRNVLRGQYKPEYILKMVIPKGNGKTRIIGNANTKDRIIQGCIHNYLYDVIDTRMSENSYGFRYNRSCQQAVLKIIEIIKSGYEWIVSIDLRDCFSNLDKHMILWLLKDAGVDEKIIKDINKIINNKYINGDKIEPVIGCPQGSNISPDLCNLVLNQLDKILEERGHPFVRYADDIYVFCKSKMAAERTLKATTRFLREKLKLEINRDKSCLFYSKEKVWSCLGFLIKQDEDIHIYINPKKEIRLRMNIRDRIANEKSEKFVEEINSLICGWISCNSIADMGKAAKRMDAYIRRNIRKYERKWNAWIDTKGLINCHDYYRKMRQQNRNKAKEPDIVGNTTPKQCNNQLNHASEHDSVVLLEVRAPPKSDSV